MTIKPESKIEGNKVPKGNVLGRLTRTTGSHGIIAPISIIQENTKCSNTSNVQY